MPTNKTRNTTPTEKAARAARLAECEAFVEAALAETQQVNNRSLLQGSSIAAPRFEPKGWPFEAGVRMQQQSVNYLAVAQDASDADLAAIKVVGNHVQNLLQDQKPTIDHIDRVIRANVPGVGQIIGENVQPDGLCGPRALYRGAKGKQPTLDQALKLRDKTLQLAVSKNTNGNLWVVDTFGGDFVDCMLMTHRELNGLATTEAKLTAWKKKMELQPSDDAMGSYTWADELFMYVASYALKVCLVVLRLGKQNAWEAPDFWHHAEFAGKKIVMVACLNQCHFIHLDSDDESKMMILCGMNELRVDKVAQTALAQIPSVNPSANAAVTQNEYEESMQAAYQQGWEEGRKLEAESWQNTYESLGQAYTLLEEENKALKCDLLDAVTLRSQDASHMADLEGTVAYLQSQMLKQQEEIQQLRKMQAVVEPVGEPVQVANALLDGFDSDEEAAGEAGGEVVGDVEALLQGFNSDEDSDAGNVSAGSTPAAAGMHEQVDHFADLINFDADAAPAAPWTMPADERTRDEIEAQAYLDALESQRIAIAAEDKANADKAAAAKAAVDAQVEADAQAAVDAQPKPGFMAGFASMFASSPSTEVPAPVAPAPAPVAQPTGPPPPPPPQPTEADFRAASAAQGEKNLSVASRNEAALKNKETTKQTQAVKKAAQAASGDAMQDELKARLAKRRGSVAPS